MDQILEQKYENIISNIRTIKAANPHCEQDKVISILKQHSGINVGESDIPLARSVIQDIFRLAVYRQEVPDETEVCLFDKDLHRVCSKPKSQR